MKRTNITNRVLLRATSALLVGLSLSRACMVWAQVPAQLTYQGYLTGGDGQPLGAQVPRAYDVIFRVFTAESAGTLLWAEQQTVTVDKGYFSVQLGSGSAVSGFTNSAAGFSSVFSGSSASDRYVALAVRGIGTGGADLSIEPRVRLLSAPFAYLAQAASSIVDSSGGTAVGFTGSGIGFNRALTASSLSTPSGTAGSLTVSNTITFAATGASTGGGSSFVRVSEGDVRLISGRHRWTNGIPNTGSAVFVTEPSPGYSVTRIGNGVYKITYDTPFNGVPAVVVTPIQPALNNPMSDAYSSNGFAVWPGSHGTFWPWAHAVVTQSKDPALACREAYVTIRRRNLYYINAGAVNNWYHWIWNGGSYAGAMVQNDYNAYRGSLWSTLTYDMDYDFQFHAVGP